MNKKLSPIALLVLVMALTLASPNTADAQIQKSDNELWLAPALLNNPEARTELGAPQAGYPLKNVIIVAKRGGNFTSIKAALARIKPTATNRFLIWVAPGTYKGQVIMKPYVSIVGAGEGLTIITYPGEDTGDTGTVVGANNAELRSLTVSSTANGSYAIGIYNDNASPVISHVSVLATGGTLGTFGVFNRNGAAPTLSDMNIEAVSSSALSGTSLGIHNLNNVTLTANNVKVLAVGGSLSAGIANFDGCVLNMTNVSATASDAARNEGIRNDTLTTGTMTNSVATATGGDLAMGMYVEEASFTISASIIRASDATETYGIYIDVPNMPSSYELRVVNSELTGETSTIRNDPNYITKIGGTSMFGGAVIANGGTLICAGVFDEDFSFFANTCP